MEVFGNGACSHSKVDIRYLMLPKLMLCWRYPFDCQGSGSG